MNNKYSKKPNRVLRGAWGSVIHKSKAKLFDDDGTVDTTTDVTNDHASSEHASFMKAADNSWLVGAGQLWRAKQQKRVTTKRSLKVRLHQKYGIDRGERALDSCGDMAIIEQTSVEE
ncbi:predicted protein [Thalassiosira pseudonana CCMP1335]|uniref:Uncharacterized protein n=1 Tax=Thalassiosira pseudonana TaxID=35128 RepID=B8CDQ1_THAPS|nr:predicted protein [Thalassiosira pseudonana CCMP1335]EED88500.1 predicted protein [Thalassiosira pseudonana CCMP1335]